MLAYAPSVERVITIENISVDELALMVERAAVTSVRGFNRRFHHWLFKVRSGSVEAMQCLEMVEVGKGMEAMRELCDDCEGEGCPQCRWVGEIVRRM